jgi:glyoxylase-like metal-dependent hydrolase (beta-lactamase superfamily II)
MVFIDSGNGGSLSGMIKNLEQALKMMNKETVVVPGHGQITNYETVKRYLEGLIIAKEKLIEMINNDMSLEEIIENNPIKNLEEILGDTTILINRSYLSLTKDKTIKKEL